MNAFSALSSLGDADLRALAAALRSGRIGPQFVPLAVEQVVSGATDAIAAALQSFAEAGFNRAQIALAINLLAEDRRLRPRQRQMDLVTTGPDSEAAASRDTGVVVRELFSSAEASVHVVGFSVYQGDRVFRALADRMVEQPAMRVQLFLDINRREDDPAEPAVHVSRFVHRFRESQWPEGAPFPEVFYFSSSLSFEPGKRASLHAKCIVVDRRILFVTSANFTEAAQERNIEAGLLIHDAPLADQVARHFESLVAQGALERIL